MANRGFEVKELLSPKGATLNIPPFLSQCKQLKATELEKTRRTVLQSYKFMWKELLDFQ